MIEQVKKFSQKSFVNYTGPVEKFAEVNILFGYNGRGKTSLANGLVEEFLKDSNNEEKNYRFFNRNYITNNLMLEQSKDSKIKGVIANFGKKDVDSEKQIKELESKIIDTKELRNELIKLNKEVRDEIDRIHDTKKGDIAISKKPKSKSNEEVISLYNEDIKQAKKIESDEEKLLNTKGDNSIENERSKIEKVLIPQISSYKKEELMNIKEIFAKKYDNIDIPSSKIISWITDGIELHKEGDICKFCGGNIELSNIKNKIEQYNKNEKQKDSVILTNFNDKLISYISELDSLLRLKDGIIVNLEQDVTASFECIKNNKELLKDYQHKFDSKIEDINGNIEFDDDNFLLIVSEIDEAYEKIVNEKNQKLKTLNEKESKINILIKGAIGLEIKNNTFINNTMTRIKEKSESLKQIEQQNKDNLKKIDELRKSKSNTKDFADHISMILSMLEINLKLEVVQNDYVIKQSITKDILKIEDISEGEQNLLALLYFYYELFNDNEQKELKDEVKMIIIDDPIASVDDVNKMYVLELVKKVIELKNAQIFTFTHVWEDFCNICYGKLNNSNYKFFEIKKDTTGSKIEVARTNETPYKHNFKDIYEFSQKSDCSNLNDCEIYHYPNIMRKILEEYLSFKVKNSSPTSSNINNIKLALCGEKYSANDELRLGTLLNVCNILSHKASRNPDEILKSAKFLMNKIKDSDKLHFYTMIQ